MRKEILLLFAVTILTSASLFAQASRITINVPFEFITDGASHAAGSYEILLTTGTSGKVQLRSAERSDSPVFLTVLTRISQIPGDESFVVFDKVGDKSYLAEVHVAGMDGFHLKGAPGPHSHVRVTASR